MSALWLIPVYLYLIAVVAFDSGAWSLGAMIASWIVAAVGGWCWATRHD